MMETKQSLFVKKMTLRHEKKHDEMITIMINDDGLAPFQKMI